MLMEWVNAELLPEHIVVRSLEEDMFDGLILHHLFRKRRAPRRVLLPPAQGGGPRLSPGLSHSHCLASIRDVSAVFWLLGIAERPMSPRRAVLAR